MTFERIQSQLLAQFSDQVILDIDENASPKAVIISTESLLQVMEFLAVTEGLYFDMLSCLTGIDNGEEAQTLEVVYNLYSIPYGHHLMVKVQLNREHPEIESVERIWKTANWHEREAYDLLGISFLNHPDLRRILLPQDWEGHPLLKDYAEQEKYHGVKVKY